MTIANPVPFTTPIVAADQLSGYRSGDYLSPSEYSFAPTAVGTKAIVSNSDAQQLDSLASLAQVISRVSAKINQFVFHRPDGTFISSLSVEQHTITVKPDNSLNFSLNFPPLRQLIGLEIGWNPSQLAPIGQQTAQTIVPNRFGFSLPGALIQTSPQPTYSPGWPTAYGRVVGLMSYVNGWPHFRLAASAEAAQNQVVLAPVIPTDTALYGIFPGYTALEIKDGGATETVLVESVSGNTITTVSPLVFPHTLPSVPDWTPVTALPQDIEEAAVSLVSVLLKARGNRALNLPGSIGSPSPAQAKSMGRAGVLDDWMIACGNLKPYRLPVTHSA